MACFMHELADCETLASHQQRNPYALAHLSPKVGLKQLQVSRFGDIWGT